MSARQYGRRGRGRNFTTKPMANRHPGPCRYCGEEVPAHAGLLDRVNGAWVVRHRPAEWVGSPVSGSWVGGCPREASISMSAPEVAP